MRPPLFTDDMASALPSDEEMDLVNRYTGGFMTDAEVEAFEDRLHDPAFFYRVAPLIKLWYKREPLPIEREIAQRIEARRAAGLPLVERSHVGTIVAAVTVTALPIKAAIGVAAAAVLVAVATIDRPKESGPAPVFVHVVRPVPTTPLTQTPTVVATTPHRKTVTPKVDVAVAAAEDPQPKVISDSGFDMPPMPGMQFVPTGVPTVVASRGENDGKIDSVMLTVPALAISKIHETIGDRVRAALGRVRGWFGKLPKAIPGQSGHPMGPPRGHF